MTAKYCRDQYAHTRTHAFPERFEEITNVDIFGLSPTKYLNEDSQTLGNKNPSLHRKAAELQSRRPPEGRLQGELRQLRWDWLQDCSQICRLED
jgi:hypothetical protein